MTIAGVIKIGSIVAQIVEYAMKTVQVVDAGVTVYDTIQDAKLSGGKKTQRVVINCLFMVAQSAEMISHARGSSEKWQLGTKFAAGATDVARAIDDGASAMEVVARSGYRVLDMAGCYVDHHPEISEKTKHTLDVAETILMVYSDRKKISDSIQSLRNRVIFHRGRFFHFHVQDQPAASVAPPAAAAAAPDADAIHVQVEGVLVEHRGQLGQEVDAVVQTREIGEWQTIPNLFLTDDVLCRTLCSITHRPIRFLLTVTATKDLEDPIYYERAEITRWLEEHPPEQPPTNWPEGVLVQMASLSSFLPMQGQIDRRLKQLLENARGAAELLRSGVS